MLNIELSDEVMFVNLLLLPIFKLFPLKGEDNILKRDTIDEYHCSFQLSPFGI